MINHNSESGVLFIPIKPPNNRRSVIVRYIRLIPALLISLMVFSSAKPVFAASTDDDLQQVTQIFTRGGSVD